MKTDQFVFFPASGEQIRFDLNGICEFEGRISKSGRKVIKFPAPFDGLEIVEGERVGPQKMQRIKNAIAGLHARHSSGGPLPTVFKD